MVGIAMTVASVVHEDALIAIMRSQDVGEEVRPWWGFRSSGWDSDDLLTGDFVLTALCFELRLLDLLEDFIRLLRFAFNPEIVNVNLLVLKMKQVKVGNIGRLQERKKAKCTLGAVSLMSMTSEAVGRMSRWSAASFVTGTSYMSIDERMQNQLTLEGWKAQKEDGPLLRAREHWRRLQGARSASAVAWQATGVPYAMRFSQCLLPSRDRRDWMH